MLKRIPGESLCLLWYFGVDKSDLQSKAELELQLSMAGVSLNVENIALVATDIAATRKASSEGSMAPVEVARASMIFPEEHLSSGPTFTIEWHGEEKQIPFSWFCSPQRCARLLMHYLAGELTPVDVKRIADDRGLKSHYTRLARSEQGMFYVNEVSPPHEST